MLWCYFEYLFPTTAPSGPPQQLRVETVTSTSVSLQWSPPDFSLQNGIISGYIIQLIEDKTLKNFTYSTTDTHLTIGSLNPSSVYTCYVAAENSAGKGPYSSKLEVELQNDGMLTIIIITMQATRSHLLYRTARDRMVLNNFNSHDMIASLIGNNSNNIIVYFHAHTHLLFF